MRLAVVAAVALAGAGTVIEDAPRGAAQARLTARPDGAVRALEPGDRRVDDGALLYVPASARAPAPLLVMLHGAAGEAARQLDQIRALADGAGFAALVPQSRGVSWDLVRGTPGPDVEALDRALGEVFATAAIDPARVAVGGFSDGASYALALGLANGDLFRAVLAFSPGFVAAPSLEGRARFFVSHGDEDAVLPVDRCGREVVKRLRARGYEVRYDEFHGPHAVPPRIAREAVEWWLGPRP